MPGSGMESNYLTWQVVEIIGRGLRRAVRINMKSFLK